MCPSLIVHTIKLATIILLLIAFEGANATNYYISYRRGRDSWKGTSVSKPWKSLEKISQLTFSPGDSILLECGNSWNGHIQLNGSGEANNPIVLASFGEGEKPILNGSGNHYTILIRNQEYWRILGLEITNFDEREEGIDLWAWEMRNKNIWASSIEPLAPFKDARNQKHAILVEAIDVGCVNGLYFKNLEIHGVNGAMSTKHNGGIFLAVRGDRIATWFDDLVVEGCYIHDVDRTGISNISSWNNRTLTRNVNWVPSKNIVIRNNVFERTGANALIVRVAEGPIIEYNLFDHCSIKGSGNANFPFNCDHAVIRFNEARFTKYNLGDADAGGFDSDYRCKNTVIEYNYSHHNEFGGILICCMGGDDESRFNYGTKIRTHEPIVETILGPWKRST